MEERSQKLQQQIADLSDVKFVSLQILQSQLRQVIFRLLARLHQICDVSQHAPEFERELKMMRGKLDSSIDKGLRQLTLKSKAMKQKPDHKIDEAQLSDVTRTLGDMSQAMEQLVGTVKKIEKNMKLAQDGVRYIKGIGDDFLSELDD
eukprot:gnl/Carplike_NY0171/3169_a4258_539.p1 GENE.gnl/Carplike_NY0171/3169_a4258_539~~gnl/Carplike_NY0171/3169_a4258_539.p1  ORF type:complete len:148 (-),score=38.09 gnl/Carplike_NY0171/3169_a4258_539:59-502(-)